MSNLTSNDSSIQPFNFENHPVRVLRDDDGEAWFIAADICRVLEYANTAQTIKDHVDQEDTSTLDRIHPSDISNISGKSPLVINESGLYSLILRSNQEGALKFKRWVTKEVLPSIRKTGAYIMASTGDHLLDAIEALKQNRMAQLALERQQREQEQRIEYLEEKVDVLSAEEEYYTVIGYFLHRQKQAPPREQLAQIGKRAAAISRTLGMPIGKTHHPVYGQVNTYHEQILAQVTGW